MTIHFAKQSRYVLIISAATIAVLCTTLVKPAFANTTDDAIAACIEAARLLKDDNDVSGALEEANWCVSGIKQLSQEQTLSFLPDEVEGFIGGEIESQDIMGMSIIEREYTSDDQSLTLSLNRATGDGGGLGALAQLGSLFGAAGATGGGRQVRIQKRTVTAADDGDGATLSAQLKSGGTLSVESPDMDAEELIEFMRAFPLAELDDSLQ